MRTIILLILLVSSCQNEQKISILEKELNILFDAKNNERDEKYKERFDSLLQVCLNDSNSFTYPFHDLKRTGKFNIMQSPDKKLRVYSYEDFGGTIRNPKNRVTTIFDGNVYRLTTPTKFIPTKNEWMFHPSIIDKNTGKLQPPNWNDRNIYKVTLPAGISTNYLNNKLNEE